MGLWYCKNLGDAMLAGPALDALEAQFTVAFRAASCPNNMALLIRHESEGRLHCELIAYFSPAAREVAQRLGATSCRAPSADGLHRVAGGEDSLSATAARRRGD
jgi:hypothetical protein